VSGEPDDLHDTIAPHTLREARKDHFPRHTKPKMATCATKSKPNIATLGAKIIAEMHNKALARGDIKQSLIAWADGG